MRSIDTTQNLFSSVCCWSLCGQRCSVRLCRMNNSSNLVENTMIRIASASCGMADLSDDPTMLHHQDPSCLSRHPAAPSAAAAIDLTPATTALENELRQNQHMIFKRPRCSHTLLMDEVELDIVTSNVSQMMMRSSGDDLKRRKRQCLQRSSKTNELRNLDCASEESKMETNSFQSGIFILDGGSEKAPSRGTA